MSEWEPATDAEVAMRDALRTDDQESYFRILAGVDLLLPVSADALAGLAPLGWGTWSTGGRTHVLAFTSPAALQACLADYTGSARRVAYAELADTWPNLEWWLAVNPGLPIEGYLPAWFVAQLSRGDLRLPTRGPARDGGKPATSQQDLQAAAMAANAAASGGPMSPPAAPVARDPGSAGPAYQPDNDFGRGAENPGAGARPPSTQGDAGGPREQAPAPADRPQPVPAPPGYAQPAPTPAGYAAPGSAPAGYAAPGPAPAGYGPPAPAPAGYATQAPAGRPGAPAPTGYAGGGGGGGGGGGNRSDPGQVGPGGLPIRTPGGVLPSGLPSRVPAAPQGGDSIGGFSGFATRGGAVPPPSNGGGREQDGNAPGDPAAPVSGGAAVPSAYRPPDLPAGPRPTTNAPDSPAGPPPGGPSGPPTGPLPRPPGAATSTTPLLGGSSPPPTGPTVSGPPSAQSPRGPLPTRTPMAQTPPLPSHLTAAEAQPGSPEQGAASEPHDADAGPPPASDQQTADDQVVGGPDTGSSLPRRQVTPPSERPASMAAAAQALAAGRGPGSPGQTADTRPTRPGLAPPVIPGAGGSGRSDRTPFVPAPSLRPEIPSAGAAGPGPGASQPQATPPIDQPAPDASTPDSVNAPRPGIGPGNSGTADDDDFVPANPVEQDLYNAADAGNTDAFLSTLLLATVLVPVADNSRPGSSPGESGFAFRTEELDGERFLVVFTSRDRLSEHFAEPARTVGVKFLELIRNWPDPDWSFAVNPNTPVGAKYPGPQVIALASWATEAGLGADPEIEAAAALAPLPHKVSDAAQHATVMQKTIPAEQVDYYLDRGYDRVAGFVHRANEVEHLRTPAELFAALGLVHDGSPYHADAKEAFVLRWPAYRPSLYRIPYGGQSEQALRAMDGWVIERPPFRGNGFAPGEGRDVVAEFKVDSVRLPHGAQLWRMDADGNERMIAVFDCDAPNWRRVGEH